MSTSDNIRILISYSHDSKEHKERVLRLAERLESHGIDCHLDQYETSPPEGWPRWMCNQIRQADFVLVICTETYRARYDGTGESGEGLGAKWEGLIIRQEIYESEGRNRKFIPVAFTEDDAKYIPAELRSGTWYVLDGDEVYLELYARITNQPRVRKGPLGERLILTSGETGAHLHASQAPVQESTNSSPSAEGAWAPRAGGSEILPMLDVIGAALETGVVDGAKLQVWGVALKVFIAPKEGSRIVIPFHRCKGVLAFPRQNFNHPFSKIAIRPWSRNSSAVAATETEAVINAPGTFIVTAEITRPDIGWKPGGDAHVAFDLYSADTGRWIELRETLPICMSNYSRWERGDSLTVFEAAPFVVY
jgi:TIR domain